jgi:hypothetical protein
MQKPRENRGIRGIGPFQSQSCYRYTNPQSLQQGHCNRPLDTRQVRSKPASRTGPSSPSRISSLRQRPGFVPRSWHGTVFRQPGGSVRAE